MDVSSFYNLSNNSVITYRYNTYSTIESYVKEFFSTTDFPDSSIEILGKSVLGKSIYGFKIGSVGPKILLWSQMHGNESTMTRSLFLTLELIKNDPVLKNIQLYIIPVLNPDGNEDWIRNNANNVDLNRDAQDLSQPESQLLKSVIDNYQPDFAFNLHDQRTIYGNLEGTQAMQLSFLAPASDYDSTITSSRLKSMDLINAMVKHCHQFTNHGIGRYNDAFNANCVGDALASLQIPVVLFEAGHAGDDYNRDATVVLMSQALIQSFIYISNGFSKLNQATVVKEYKAIPEMATSYCDILLKNVPSDHDRVDIAIMYKEIIDDDILYYVPFMTSINDVAIKNGHRLIDLASYESVDLDFEITVSQKITSKLFKIESFC